MMYNAVAFQSHACTGDHTQCDCEFVSSDRRSMEERGRSAQNFYFFLQYIYILYYICKRVYVAILFEYLFVSDCDFAGIHISALVLFRPNPVIKRNNLILCTIHVTNVLSFSMLFTFLHMPTSVFVLTHSKHLT
jgi:hypothetical protein